MLNLCAGAMLASVVAAVPAFHRGMAPEMMQDSSVSNDGSDYGVVEHSTNKYQISTSTTL